MFTYTRGFRPQERPSFIHRVPTKTMFVMLSPLHSGSYPGPV